MEMRHAAVKLLRSRDPQTGGCRDTRNLLVSDGSVKIERLELAVNLKMGFARPDDQPAAVRQTLIKSICDAVNERHRKVDGHVPAEDQIEVACLVGG